MSHCFEIDLICRIQVFHEGQVFLERYYTSLAFFVETCSLDISQIETHFKIMLIMFSIALLSNAPKNVSAKDLLHCSRKAYRNEKLESDRLNQV